MRTFWVFLAGIVLVPAGWAAVVLPGDARDGAALFKDQRCVACHSVNGEGGKSAPDLGRITGRDFSPSQMAALMWNHAPAMWSRIEKEGLTRPVLSEQQAADLFAFFYAARYFEKPGDAGRGKALFASKHCGSCHAVSTPQPGGGPAVVSWRETLADPIAMSAQMWSHASGMREAMAKRKMSWPVLTGQELSDILVYLQNLPEMKGLTAGFSPAVGDTGEKLFQVKGCVGCHVGKNSLTGRKTRQTLNGFAAAMWNHSGRMKQASLSYEEMRRIVGYLWANQIFQEAGRADRGKRVFAGKQCGTCHGSSAPNLTTRDPKLNSFGMVSALWRHGPGMQAQMAEKKINWPRFRNTEMADLIEYLSTGKP